MRRHRAPSRRTVVAVAGIGAVVALAFLLAPGSTGPEARLEVLLVASDGTVGPTLRLGAATLERLRRPSVQADSIRAGAPDSTAAAGAAPDSVRAALGPPEALGPARPAPGDPVAPAAEESALPAEPAAEPPALRIPLVLAARAEGGRVPRPTSLRLAVPAPFTLVGGGPSAGAAGWRGSSVEPVDAAGTEMPAGAEGPSATVGDPPDQGGGWGEPLAHHDVPVGEVAFGEGGAPAALTAPDTLWLEYRPRDADCRLGADSVPRFVAPAPPPRAALRDVRIFYGLATAAGEWHTGVLRLDLELPPDLEPPPDAPERGAVELRAGGFPLADSLLLPRATYPGICTDGTRTHRLTVRFLAADASPARAYLVGAGTRPRLRLEDLDGDDVLEREAWDPDGDGRFEARRTLALSLPRALRSPERRAVLERQRREAARLAAEEAARRAAAAARRPPPDTATDTAAAPPRPSADTAAPPRPPPDTAAPPRPPPDTAAPPRPPPDTVSPPDRPPLDGGGEGQR